METFKIFDKDGSKEIDPNEAIKHWESNFGKLSAKEFFKSVDFDGDGNITQDEFLRYWRIVKGAGNSEEDIQTELENINKGELWTGFDNVKSGAKMSSKD